MTCINLRISHRAEFVLTIEKSLHIDGARGGSLSCGSLGAALATTTNEGTKFALQPSGCFGSGTTDEPRHGYGIRATRDRLLSHRGPPSNYPGSATFPGPAAPAAALRTACAGPEGVTCESVYLYRLPLNSI